MPMNNIPDWLNTAVEVHGGRILCDQEIFQNPDGSWAVWCLMETGKPVLNLPSKEIAECVAEAINHAFNEGGRTAFYE